ncbi:Ribosome-associated translation inhibitor RaiA [Limimonas halophila]|uniref:Ribosome-associated translation inhibitor RaiA n=1 Tax=Limimonas halophila TaxID=1082479 RepID=A0A1G7LAJ0_9PROT|nr:HPF/RaiA family ribosome-associated protein [Limimonas halophila]SDF46401.1 Ribosome-associated translation inhibitor RaiA [Limimonas halophila]
MAETDALQIPLDVAFQGMEATPHIDHQVRRQVKKLERFRQHITNVRAVVEAQHKSAHKAQLHIKLEISVPGKLIVAEREGRPHDAVERADVYGVIREAVDVAIRQLDAYISKHFHPEKPQASERKRATITYLDRERRVGQLETDAGETYDFDAEALPEGAFDSLHEGSAVTFEAVRVSVTEATRVHPVGEGA